jgi:polysaccharide export outer membrane protein
MKILIAALLPVILLGCILGGDTYAQDVEYRIQPTDVLTITVHNQPDLTTKTRVTKEGYITFPLLEQVNVVGMTAHEIEQKLKALLEKDFLVNAQVMVFIEEYHLRQVSVVGEVKSPGKYELPSEKVITLMQAIGMAGGFTKDADVEKVAVMRVEEGQQKSIKINTKDITLRGDKSKDIPVEAGDVILAPQGFSQVSVIGEVNRPGKFDMPQEKSMTLLEAIAMAEGFTKDADVRKVRVMRAEGGQKQAIYVNIEDITDRGDKDKDITLKADDIVYVPESFF